MSSFIDHYTKNDFLVKEGRRIDENAMDNSQNNIIVPAITVSVPSYTKKKDDKGDKYVVCVHIHHL